MSGTTAENGREILNNAIQKVLPEELQGPLLQALKTMEHPNPEDKEKLYCNINDLIYIDPMIIGPNAAHILNKLLIPALDQAGGTEKHGTDIMDEIIGPEKMAILLRNDNGGGEG